MWARKFERCIRCGLSTNRHVSRGLCSKCYYKEVENDSKRYGRLKGFAGRRINKQYLLDAYVNNRKSLGEIATSCRCSRQYIHKMMKFHKISLRTLQDARKIALDNKKIHVSRQHEDGSVTITTYHKIRYDNRFFRDWSKEMAYALGLIYTDGCLSMQKNAMDRDSGSPHLSFAQKGQELVIKLLALMSCNAKIHHRIESKYGTITSGEVYYFDFECKSIYPDLIRLGLKSKKSLDIRFPDIPDEYVRHFIRGCWDGDGSVYLEKRSGRIYASFVSGSSAFIHGFVAALVKAGLPLRTIYERKTNPPSYYIRFGGKQCELLYKYLYYGVSSEQRLERKYERFRSCFGPLSGTKTTQHQLF